MFKTKHTKMAFFAAGVLCCAVLTGIANSVKAAREEIPEPVPQDMNDRIIAATFKCVQAGMEPELREKESSMFPNKDAYFVICTPPGGKESNLDRLRRQMGVGYEEPEQFKSPKKQTPPNPDSFETKSKVTQ